MKQILHTFLIPLIKNTFGDDLNFQDLQCILPQRKECSSFSSGKIYQLKDMIIKQARFQYNWKFIVDI